MKPIKLTEKKWHLLKTRLTNDYSPSVMLIRSKKREVLGFTERNHQYYDEAQHRYISHVFLDFFDEVKRTMFMLKYSEYFNDSRN